MFDVYHVLIPHMMCVLCRMWASCSCSVTYIYGPASSVWFLSTTSSWMASQTIFRVSFDAVFTDGYFIKTLLIQLYYHMYVHIVYKDSMYKIIYLWTTVWGQQSPRNKLQLQSLLHEVLPPCEICEKCEDATVVSQLLQIMYNLYSM